MCCVVFALFAMLAPPKLLVLVDFVAFVACVPDMIYWAQQNQHQIRGHKTRQFPKALPHETLNPPARQQQQQQ